MNSQQTDHKAALIEQNDSLALRKASKGTPMDDTDQQLIGLLRDDARASLVSLAKALRVSRATVQNRISRLEANGTIVGYTVRLKPEAQAHRIRALTTIAVDGNRGD